MEKVEAGWLVSDVSNSSHARAALVSVVSTSRLAPTMQARCIVIYGAESAKRAACMRWDGGREGKGKLEGGRYLMANACAL